MEVTHCVRIARTGERNVGLAALYTKFGDVLNGPVEVASFSEH